MKVEICSVIECVRNSPVITFATVVNGLGDEGVRRAEKAFLDCIKENTSLQLEDQEEINDLLMDGYFEQDEYSVSLVWAIVD